MIGSDEEIGERLIADRRVPLISATGSTRMGRSCRRSGGRTAGAHPSRTRRQQRRHRDGRCEPELALRGILFGAVGTAGQRCTSIRRLFVQRGIAAQLDGETDCRLPADSLSAIRWTRNADGSADRRGGGRSDDDAACRRPRNRAGKSCTAAAVSRLGRMFRRAHAS